MLPYARERRIALEAVLKGCKATQVVFKKLANKDVLTKLDHSPSTIVQAHLWKN